MQPHIVKLYAVGDETENGGVITKLSTTSITVRCKCGREFVCYDDMGTNGRCGGCGRNVASDVINQQTIPTLPPEYIAKRYINKKKDAIQRGITFDISLQSFINIMSRKRCPFTNVPLTMSNVSIDRIDNTKGYVRGNVVACDTHFNHRKDRLLLNEMKAVLKLAKKNGLI